jgi:hypothetical protein
MRWFVLILFLIPSLVNSQTWDFDVSMDGKHIGDHQFSLTVKGEATKAEHYKIDTSKFKIDIWYGLDGQWLALQSLTSDGRVDYALK